MSFYCLLFLPAHASQPLSSGVSTLKPVYLRVELHSTVASSLFCFFCVVADADLCNLCINCVSWAESNVN